MKKFLLSLAAAVLAAGTIAAQDMATATETYNNGAMALQTGDNATALAYFEQALALGEACGDEGAELVGNCRDIIPQVTLAIAKDMIQANDLDNAVLQLQKAVEINAKDFAGAAAAYEQTVALDPDNGNAYLRLGTAYSMTGDVASAEKYFNEAMKYGQEANATKQLSNLYLRVSQSCIKAKKYEDGIAAALKSNEYSENANAMYLAGNAAMKLDRKADAISYYEKYVAISPNAKNVNDIYYTIAVVSQQAGDNAKACGYYQKILSHPTYGATAKAQIQALKCN